MQFITAYVVNAEDAHGERVDEHYSLRFGSRVSNISLIEDRLSLRSI